MKHEPASFKAGVDAGDKPAEITSLNPQISAAPRSLSLFHFFFSGSLFVTVGVFWSISTLSNCHLTASVPKGQTGTVSDWPVNTVEKDMPKSRPNVFFTVCKGKKKTVGGKGRGKESSYKCKCSSVRVECVKCKYKVPVTVDTWCLQEMFAALVFFFLLFLL